MIETALVAPMFCGSVHIMASSKEENCTRIKKNENSSTIEVASRFFL